MASKCINDCVNINNDAVCVRPSTTYAEIHKWPMAEVEFVRSISHGGSHRRSTFVESLSCRQMYLRSYTFSRKEESEESEDGGQGGGDSGDQRNERRCFRGGKGKNVTKKGMGKSNMTSLRRFVVRFAWKCLSCTSPNKVDAEH